MSSEARTAHYVPEARWTPVWVDLDVLYPVSEIDGAVPDDDAARAGGRGSPRPDGLVLHGEVPGFLHRWSRGTDGRWLAHVSFMVPYAAGITPGIKLDHALLPRLAVRLRVGAGRGPAADIGF